MKRTIRVFILLISLVLLRSALPIVSAAAAPDQNNVDDLTEPSVSFETGGENDYVGMISRRDKYDKYVIKQTNADHVGLWYHKIYLRMYSSVICLSSSLQNYMNDDLRNKYFSVPPFSELEWKDDSVRDKYDDYFKSEAAKTGFPEMYYFVRFAGITKDELKYAIEGVLSSCDLEYADWMADTMYCDDWRVIIETYMSPELVIDIEAYMSDKPKYTYIENELIYDFWDYSNIYKTPDQVLNTPLETLDKWNYSDEYWYDYYSFIDYLNREQGNSTNSIASNSSFKHSPEKQYELARRLAIYAERVGKSPVTGDTSGTHVMIFASAAVLAAAVPAMMLTVKRRRKEE